MDDQAADTPRDEPRDKPAPRPLAADDVQRVEAERVDGEPRPDRQSRRGRASQREFKRGGAHFQFIRFTTGNSPELRPPVLAAWICLVIAWVFLGSKVPFTVFLGIPFNLAALVLAAACLGRGGLFTGVFVMGLGTIGSFVVYLVGLFRFLGL